MGNKGGPSKWLRSLVSRRGRGTSLASAVVGIEGSVLFAAREVCSTMKAKRSTRSAGPELQDQVRAGTEK
jgi:hypothetical protein